MGTWVTVNSDIKIDSNFGDISIKGGDLELNKKKKNILTDVIIERFKTNYNDFILSPDYGADLEKFIGRGIDVKLLEEVKTSLRYSLTYDDFISNNELDLVLIVLNNSLKIYVYIQIDGKEDEAVVIANYTKEGITFD